MGFLVRMSLWHFWLACSASILWSQELINAPGSSTIPHASTQAEKAYHTLRTERLNARLVGVRAKRAAEEAAAAKDAA